MAAEGSITFERAQGGLGRPLPGEDHLSAKVFYTDGALPTGFTSGDCIKKIFSVADAEDLGISDTHADETKGTGGQVTVTGTWIVGEIVRIEMAGGSLGQFVLTATTITSLVAGLVAAINANTNSGLNHGWVAVDADPIITLTQPAKLGVINNAGSNLVFVDRNATDTAASAGGSSTDVQFTGGVGSYHAVMHYHISEFFRIQPDGIVWVGIFAENTYAGTEVKTITDFADGNIRQTAVFIAHESFASSQLTATNTVLDTIHSEFAPQNVVLHSDLTSATLATLPNISSLTAPRVSKLISEDGDWHQPVYSNTKAYLPGNKVTFQGAAYIAKNKTTGNSPFDATKWTFISVALNLVEGYTIGTTGAALGAVSLSSVEQNIGATDSFNLVTGTGLQVPAYATGELYKNVAQTLKDTLNGYHYIYLRNYRGDPGTFFNDSWTAVAATNDFATIENNRTIDKAERLIRTFNLDNQNTTLNLAPSTGQISEDTIARFENDTIRALRQMQDAGEIAGSDTDPGYLVTINPEQDVLAASEIKIGVVIVPKAIARQISFIIGLTVKTQN